MTNCPWCNRRVLPLDLRPRDARPAVGCVFCIDAWRPTSENDWLADGTTVWSSDGQTRGVIRGRRDCQLGGCTGMCVRVVWPDGKVTWPCSKGLAEAGEVAGLSDLRIMS